MGEALPLKSPSLASPSAEELRSADFLTVVGRLNVGILDSNPDVEERLRKADVCHKR